MHHNNAFLFISPKYQKKWVQILKFCRIIHHNIILHLHSITIDIMAAVAEYYEEAQQGEQQEEQEVSFICWCSY